MSSSGRVVVIGSANADLVVALNRRPGPGETVMGSDLVVSPGGKGANQAVAAGRLGADVVFLGAVGEDEHGALLLDSLRGAGVDVSHVARPDRPTGNAYIMVTPDGENSIVVSPGANSAVSESDVDAARAVLADAAVMVLSLEIPLSTVDYAVARAVELGVRPVLNLSPTAELSAEVLAALNPLVVNEHEAAWLLGSDGAPEDLAARLLDVGPRSVVVTIGAKGAVVADRDGVQTVPSPRVTPVDTTGAGDAFTGALAGRLAAGEDMVEAARFAVRVAATSVTRHGAQPSYPRADEVLG
ncbi:ribokinase [Allokutzneria sp. A3M-2-11 16]|uniref:ribokinase n=1 Tax=Allokutzneria sp. A3M-2-11 16 TaxID=2962043 RepID=UPI0020B7CA48|nr:PfkB family carbohydrate kinase [Allokutzneria sp. A3M-2-11 16]MCP3799466.1 ribokinase [Allokutzneria sp. A3M-2-11 16]